MGSGLLWPLGPCGPPWAHKGRAFVGWALAGPPGPLRAPLGPYGPPWALAGSPGLPWALSGRALVGRAVVGAPLALMGRALMGHPGIYAYMYMYDTSVYPNNHLG